MKTFQLKDAKKFIHEILHAKPKNQENALAENLSKDYDEIIRGHATQIGKMLDIDPMEALLFAFIIGKTLKSESTNISYLYEQIHSHPLLSTDIITCLETLKKRGYVISTDVENYGLEKNHYVPDVMLQTVMFGEFKCNTSSLKSCIDELKRTLDQIMLNPNILKYAQDDIVYTLLQIETPAFKAFASKYLDCDVLILLFAFVAFGASNLEFDYEGFSFTEELLSIVKMKHKDPEKINAFLAGKGPLFNDQILKRKMHTNGRMDYYLNEKAQNIMYPNMQTESTTWNLPGEFLEFISPEKIKEQHLFFENDVKKETDLLINIMQEDRYQSFLSKVSELNGCEGISCLFHGSPGTGKTEFALQLARSSGRMICQVDISKIRGKYVGESEENASGIFKEYYRVAKQTKQMPILLFNESDALISKRMDIRNSVDAMSNALQNIFLEELENFKGILIATTNHIQNMDEAFDRRFLMKIRFQKPSGETRKNIILQHLPMLDAHALQTLSDAYAFTGAELTNLVRRVRIFELIENRNPTLEELLQIADSEKDMRKRHASALGFK